MIGAVGVDPGGRMTGVVGRRGDELVYGAVVTRDDPAPAPDSGYLEEVVSTVSAAFARLREVGVDNPPVVVEGVVQPTGHMGTIGMSGLLGTAVVLGAVMLRFPACFVVNPGGFGALPLAAYPRELRGPKEVKGTGRYRHIRSAWDIARAAEWCVHLPAGSWEGKPGSQPARPGAER